MALIDPLRYPAAGLAPAEVAEVRRIKARVDAERLPRGADRATHLKLGSGGLADVEWTVQLLQMRHAARYPGLRSVELEARNMTRDPYGDDRKVFVPPFPAFGTITLKMTRGE